jgi:deazaflavin-dependent oxidoreductase (nitroreductase family)
MINNLRRYAFRAGLGFLVGQQYLYLEHAGRQSGQRRRAVLELIDHPVPGRYIVVSRTGRNPHWVRNVLANPRVTITVGSHRNLPAWAHPLSANDTTAALTRHAQVRPKSSQALNRALAEHLGHTVTDCADVTAIAFTVIDRWGYRAF